MFTNSCDDFTGFKVVKNVVTFFGSHEFFFRDEGGPSSCMLSSDTLGDKSCTLRSSYDYDLTTFFNSSIPAEFISRTLKSLFHKIDSQYRPILYTSTPNLNSVPSNMSFLFGGKPQLSSAEKIDAALTEVEMVTDMFNR